MQVRRYTKNHREKPQAVDSSEFVAFWADAKFIMAMDRKGVEWMLMVDTTLQSIEEGDKALIRTHRGALVRIDAVERSMSRHLPGKKHPNCYCTVGGREFPISRKYKSTFDFRYRDQVVQHGFVRMAIAA